MKTHLLCPVLLAALLIGSHSSLSQWVGTSGPITQKPVAFLSVAANGDTLFAGSYQWDSLYRSTNNGGTWSIVLNADHVNDIVIQNGNVYACNYNGVSRSTDFGNTWTRGNAGLPSGGFAAVNSLAFVNSLIFAATNGGVYRSSDGGDNWTNSSSGLPTLGPTIFAITVLGNNLIAGTEDGVYRSTNLGQAWSPAYGNMPIDFRGLRPRVWKLHVTDNGVFAGTDAYGVYRSTNSGAGWDSANVGLPHRTNVPALYEGIFSVAWTGNKLYVGLENRSIYISANNGVSWYRGAARITPNDLAFDLAARGSDVFAATFSGVYRSTNIDSVWVPIFTHFRASVSSRVVFATPNNLITSGLSSSWNGSIYNSFYSTNAGQSWSVMDSVSPLNYFSCFAMSDNLLLGGNSYGVFRSTDEGIHWAAADTNPARSPVNSILKVGNKIFAGAGYYYWQFGERGGVFKSTNNGATWLTTGFPDSAVSSLGANGRDLFAGTLRTIYRSTNEGATWTAANNSLPRARVYSFAAFDNNILAGIANGVYLSTNLGTSWAAANTGLSVDTLGWNYPLIAYAHNLFVGTRQGIFRSTNRGTNWVSVSEGLTGAATKIYSLAVQANTFFVGTEDGVWLRPLSEIVTSIDVNPDVPEVFILEQNYPNPFNPTTTIRYGVPRPSAVSLKVFDILGREVATLVNGETKVGRYEARFEGRDLSSGMYLCRLQAANFLATRRMLLLK